MNRAPPDDDAPDLGVLASRVSPHFGPYLRQLRAERGRSLRDAARDIGISFTYLQKLETGVRAPRPTVLLLQQIAAVYDRPTGEVMDAAGAVVARPEDHREDIDVCFRRLVLHPRLMPEGMNAKHWLDSFSTRQKRQWVEFALRLQAMLRDPQPDAPGDVRDILYGREPGGA